MPQEDQIRTLYESLRQEKRDRWNRTLPFNELLFDRWELARFLGFGEGSSIYHQTYVYGDVQVGEKTWIGPGVILDGSGGTLSIGSTCSISAGVQIYTHDSIAWALSGGRAEYRRGTVTVGDACHVGAMAVITKGVVVGDHSLVAAHSVVTQTVPPFSIVRGSPAQVVGRVHVMGDDIRLEFF